MDKHPYLDNRILVVYLLSCSCVVERDHELDHWYDHELDPWYDHELDPWYDQTKSYKINICCFSAKHETIRSKNKTLLAGKQDKVTEWSNMSTRPLLLLK